LVTVPGLGGGGEEVKKWGGGTAEVGDITRPNGKHSRNRRYENSERDDKEF